MTTSDGWLAEDPLPTDPLVILDRWQREAFEKAAQPNPHAIALATLDPTGGPSVRMVLCKRIDVEAGEVVFYSDRRSRKGRALAAHPRAAAVFYWGPQNRQARVEGEVRLVSSAEADAYFATRPSDSQIGAWASDQSQPIASRHEMEQRVAAEAARLGVSQLLTTRSPIRVPDEAGLPMDASPGDAPADIPRPPDWIGYAIQLAAVELWVSRPGRIHDRAVWSRHRDGAMPGEPWTAWHSQRLQP